MKQNEIRDTINKAFTLYEENNAITYTQKYTKEYLVYGLSDNNPAEYFGISNIARQLGRMTTKSMGRKPNQEWKKHLLFIVGYKICAKCGEIKPLDEFNVDNEKISGKCWQCKDCEKISNKYYRDNNKEEIKQAKWDNDRKITLMLLDVMKQYGKLSECAICGYKENWAALEFHHIDDKLERPKWTYSKKGKKITPKHYLYGCSVETSKHRFLEEIDNLSLLCVNCHQDISWGTESKGQKGTKLALEEYDIEYKCSVEGCNEKHNLHLHHTIENIKEASFGHFKELSKNRIISDGILINEINNGAIILCGNHHREIHNTRHLLNNIIKN